jgi:hypothetical protein
MRILIAPLVFSNSSIIGGTTLFHFSRNSFYNKNYNNNYSNKKATLTTVGTIKISQQQSPKQQMPQSKHTPQQQSQKQQMSQEK